MQFIDPEDDDPNSWISIKSLRAAAEVKSLYRASSRTSPTHSPESSVSHEPRPRSVYRTPPEPNRPELKKAKSGSISYDYGQDVSVFESLENRRMSSFENDAPRLFEALRVMHRQLVHDKAEIKALKKEIGMMQKEFVEQKLSFQTHWRKRLTKIVTAAETEYLQMKQQWEEMETKLRNKYEETIETLRTEHELELQEREEALEEAKKTTKPSPAKPEELQELEEKYQRIIEGMEKRHLEDISRMKNSATEKSPNQNSFRKQPATLRLPEVSVSPPDQSELSELRQRNIDLQRQLEEEQQKYARLQTQVQGSFRKKAPRSLAQTLDPKDTMKTEKESPEGLEVELKSLIGQINTHLENSDLFNSSYTLADSLRNLCLKIDQLSNSSFIQL